MHKYFSVGNDHILLDSIKRFNLDEVKCIYRPLYLYTKTVKNGSDGTEYKYHSMQPVKDLDTETKLNTVNYIVKLENGAFEEVKPSVVKSATNDFRVPEIRVAKALCVLADKEYTFLEKSDCKSVNQEYNRIKMLINDDGLFFKFAYWLKSRGVLFKSLTYSALVVLTTAVSIFFLLKNNPKVFTEKPKNVVAQSIEKFNEKENTDETDYGFEEVKEKPKIETNTQSEIVSSNTPKENYSDNSSSVNAVSEPTNANTSSIASGTLGNNQAENNQAENNQTVYITRTGTKYHIRSTCAGKNPIPKNLNEVKDSYEPCKRCCNR